MNGQKHQSLHKVNKLLIFHLKIYIYVQFYERLISILHRQFQFSLTPLHFQNLSLLSQSEETKFDSVWHARVLSQTLAHGNSKNKRNRHSEKKAHSQSKAADWFQCSLWRVNHQGILYRLWSVCIGGTVFSILTKFLSNRSQHVMVDGCRSKHIDFVSECIRGVFGAHYCSSCTLRKYRRIGPAENRYR